MPESLYVLAIDPSIDDGVLVKNFLNAQIEITNWIKLFDHVYFVVSSELSEIDIHYSLELYMRKSAITPAGYVVVKVEANRTTGRVPNIAWDLVNRFRTADRTLIYSTRVADAYFAAEKEELKRALPASPTQGQLPK